MGGELEKGDELPQEIKIIDPSGSPAAPPVRNNPQLELQKQVLDFLTGFGSSGKQKTDINASQRVILSTANRLAGNSFPISQKIAEERGIAMEQHQMPFFKDWIGDFIEFGIPLGRKGRGEEVALFRAFFSNIGEMDGDEKPKKNKFLK